MNDVDVGPAGELVLVEALIAEQNAAYAEVVRALGRARSAARYAITEGGKDACIRALNTAATLEAEATELAEYLDHLYRERARLEAAPRPADVDPFAGLN